MPSTLFNGIPQSGTFYSEVTLLQSLCMTLGYQYLTASQLGGTLTPNLANGCNVIVLLDANLTTVANPVLTSAGRSVDAGTRAHIVLVQDSTGNRTIGSWGAAYSGTVTLSSVANTATAAEFIVWGDGTLKLSGGNSIFNGKLAANSAQGAVASNAVFRFDGNRLQVSENGARFRSVVPADKMVDVREFGPIGSDLGGNAANDTAALLAAFAQFSADPGTSRAAQTGAIVIPPGLNLYVGQTLEYIGNPGVGLMLMGAQGQARNGQNGSCLYWVGSDSDSACLLHLRGANGTTIKNLQINGGNKAGRPVWVSEWYEGATIYDGTQIGSSGVFFENCYFNQPRASANATPVLIGMDNEVTSQLQCSEVRFYNCSFNGNGPAPGLAGCHIRSNGNTKNFTFELCIFADTDFGVYQPGGSGVTTVNQCSFENIGWNQDGACVHMGSGNQLRLEDMQFENGGTLSGTDFRARVVHTANNLVTVVTGGYCAARMPSDDIAFDLGGPTTIHGFSFEGNARTGSNVCKINAGGPLVLQGCDFAYNTTALTNVPVYSSGNHAVESDVFRNNTALDLSITASNNISGLSGATHSTYLPDARARRPTVIGGGLWRDTSNGIVAGLTVVDEDGRMRITVPYTAFQTGALTRTLTISFNTPRTWIKNVQDRVLTAFGGTAGTLTLEVGTNTSINAHLLSHDMKTLNAEKGLADADLGASLAAATRAHWKGHYLSASTNLQVKLTSSSGNLSSLNAGSVVLIYDYDYVGG